MSAPASLIGDLARLARSLSGSRAAASRAAGIALGIARGRVVLRRARCAGRVYVGGPLTVVAEGDVAIGHGVFFFGGMIASEIVCHPGASVSIGAGSQLNYGVSIEAQRSVRIGERCMIGSMARIADAGRDGAAPVVIGDDVWIAHGAIVEPGVSIGDGSVVSAGSVVTTSIPPGSLAIGNPARAVRLDTLAGAPGA